MQKIMAHKKIKKTKGLYISSKVFKISRSKLELFLRCARCFFLDQKLGIRRPSTPPWLLNTAVDNLLKKEFDAYRLTGTPHPLCTDNNIHAIPFKHNDFEKWRQSLHAGIQHTVPNTNLLLYGGVDDVWIDLNTEELIIVDYKATSIIGAITLDKEWHISFKRQVEIYQWLFRKNGFKVSDTAYFVYCNANKEVDRFDKHLSFDIALLPYVGDDTWVDLAIQDLYACLQSDSLPPFNQGCEYCQYGQCLEQIQNKRNKE